ncbi:MAG: hypothetical protein WCK10_03205 [Candidatus Staskawiczbacteria bacterium]
MNTIEHEGHHHEEKIEVFEDQQEIMKKIREIGFAKYAETVQDLPDAFNLEKHKPAENINNCICCMDERTPYGLHSAGSGILLSKEAFDDYFEKSGAKSISSHTGCGAAKLFVEKMGLAGDPDVIAREWAEQKAKEKGVPHIHLEVEKPFHFARVCYYDGTGKFNYKGVEGLPAGFVVGRKHMTKEASLAEGNVAKNIIFGDHGFGEEFLNKENPFMFVAVGETEQQTEELKSELIELTKSFGDSVVVDGFVNPKGE